MDLQEAKALAAQLKKIPRVIVLGTRNAGDEKVLIIRLGRSEARIVNPAMAYNKVVKAAANKGYVKGQTFEGLDVCSNCFRQLRSRDGHFHSVRGNVGADPICCRCVKRNGGECKIS